MVSLFGVLSKDQRLSSTVSEVLGYEALTSEKLMAITQIRRGKKSFKALQTICQSLAGVELTKRGTLTADLKAMQKALNGDVISLTALVDKMSTSDSHLRSLMASLTLGYTKYDSELGMGPKVQEQYKNLLLREVYRLFEIAVKRDFRDGRVEKEKVESFITACFQDKVPLYLVLMLTEEESLMDSLFDKE